MMENVYIHACLRVTEMGWQRLLYSNGAQFLHYLFIVLWDLHQGMGVTLGDLRK